MKPHISLLLVLALAACTVGEPKVPLIVPAARPTAESNAAAAAGTIATSRRAPVTGGVAANDGPIATGDVGALDEDQIPAPPPPPPPAPEMALLDNAIAPTPSKPEKPEKVDVGLSADQVRQRLNQRLSDLGFQPLGGRLGEYTSGPALRNPGGFSAEADCSGLGQGGQARLQAAWVQVKIEGGRRSADVEVSARFEEVRESPVRGVLVRTECKSTRKLEADLISALR